MNDVAISVRDVSMMFNLDVDQIMGLKEYVLKALRHQLRYKEFWALRDISFDVKKGEVFGIMGLNGSGKSTLLKIVAGVFKPTSGSVMVTGEIAPLLELGTGFDLEFSARENVFMNGAMFGHPPKYMKSKYAEIMDFAELWDFENVPVKKFSSGMMGRLGFAVATSVQPDVLIVDEILGVGDYKFNAKCQVRIQNMIARGVTVLLVSHNVAQIKKMCSRALLLRNGTLTCIGDVEDVCKAYGDG